MKEKNKQCEAILNCAGSAYRKIRCHGNGVVAVKGKWFCVTHWDRELRHLAERRETIIEALLLAQSNFHVDGVNGLLGRLKDVRAEINAARDASK